MDVKYLWPQQEVKKKNIRLGVVKGNLKQADMGTKYFSPKELAERMILNGYEHYDPNTNDWTTILIEQVQHDGTLLAGETLAVWKSGEPGWMFTQKWQASKTGPLLTSQCQAQGSVVKRAVALHGFQSSAGMTTGQGGKGPPGPSQPHVGLQ